MKRGLALAALVACHREPAAPAPARELHYELDVAVDPAAHTLAVTGSVERPEPFTTLHLNPKLAVKSASAPFRREDDRLVFTTPQRRVTFAYDGAFPVVEGRDFKSLAWVDPGHVRFTEASLWYPVIAASDGAWPPEPASANVRLPALDGLHWAASGVANGKTWMFAPGDLVVVAVPFAPAPVTVPTAPGRTMTFTMATSENASLAPALGATFALHAERLGTLPPRPLAIVEFPQDRTWLSFASTGLVVFSSRTVRGFAAGEPRGRYLVAHELAHAWFGGALRPEGPATFWLAEGFAEAYAWLALGPDGARDLIAEATRAAGSGRLDALPPGSELVYTRGGLAVRDLGAVVGQERLDRTIAGLAARGARWTAEALFDALVANGAPREDLTRWRATWGI